MTLAANRCANYSTFRLPEPIIRNAWSWRRQKKPISHSGNHRCNAPPNPLPRALTGPHRATAEGPSAKTLMGMVLPHLRYVEIDITKNFSRHGTLQAAGDAFWQCGWQKRLGWGFQSNISPHGPRARATSRTNSDAGTAFFCAICTSQRDNLCSSCAFWWAG